MTTTSTYQGVNVDSKPSSRVLNPPGGATSNIFGYDDQPQQQKKLNRENMDRGNDIFNQGSGAAAGPVTPKGRAQRSAYNPITGELYEPKSTGVSTETSTCSVSSKDATAGSVPGDSVTSTSTETVTEQQSESEVTPTQSTQQAPTQSTAAAAPANQQRQQGLGVFGGPSSDMQDHRSTRVSQPPGGRSTKLW